MKTILATLILTLVSIQVFAKEKKHSPCENSAKAYAMAEIRKELGDSDLGKLHKVNHWVKKNPLGTDPSLSYHEFQFHETFGKKQVDGSEYYITVEMKELSDKATVEAQGSKCQFVRAFNFVEE